MSLPKILFLRGAGPAILGNGLDQMGDKLAQNGHDVTVKKYTYGLREANRLIESKSDSVIVVGHSMGATETVDVANVLIAGGVNVPLIGCLDCHMPREVPLGVPEALSITQTHNIFVVKGFYHLTKPANYTGNLEIITRSDLKHTELDDDPEVQRILLKKITQVSGGNVVELPTPKPPNIGDLEIQFINNRFDRKIFFDNIREYPFDGLSQTQVEGMEQLLDAWEEYCLDWDVRELAYDLATAFHETGKAMQPIYEKGPRSYFNKYDIEFNPGKANVLGNTQPGDGWLFRGAGHVQNTGRGNAARATEELNARFNLGVDLVTNPEDRLDPFVSAMSLFLGNHQGWWTSKRLPNYAGYGNWDMRGARTVVNGTDKWQLIGDYAGAFMDALRAAAVAVTETVPNVPDKPPMPVPDAPMPVPVVPGGELTLDYLRSLSSAVLRQEIRSASDAINMTTLVLDERDNGETSKSNIAPTLIENNPGNEAGDTNNGVKKMALMGKKKWYKSRGILGLIGAGVSIFLPQFAPITEMLIPESATIPIGAMPEVKESIDTIVTSGQNIVTAVMLLIATWGRLFATEKL